MAYSEAAKKSLGQHWLTDETSLLAMVKAGRVEQGDTVVEIGPGLGSLTQKLVVQAGQVIAIELDEKLAEQLPKRVPSPSLSVVTNDVLTFDFTSLPADYKLVANIPYYITGHLLRILTETPNMPLTAALLLQKEVAERVAAKPGDMSVISVSVQLFYDVSLGKVVSAHLFDPPPKVDSRILILDRRKAPLFPDMDYQQFFHLVKIGFASKRKTLLNSLNAGFVTIAKDELSKTISAVGINPQIRPQELSLEDWYKLYQALAG